MNVYILDCETESGDSFCYVFKNYPADYEVIQLLADNHPEEYDDEGYSLISWQIIIRDIIDN